MMNTSTSVPKTCQPWPRTSCLLRPNDASAPLRSMTMTGMITAQIVISHRPGTMIRMSPIVIAMPARMDAAATDQMYGVAADTVSLIDRSARPSRTSWTALTSVACSRKAANSSTMEPSSDPKTPASESKPATMAAAT